MITAVKNGHQHEFSEQVWERMGTGDKRMGWTLLEAEQVSPIPTEVLKMKQKNEQPVVENKVEEEVVVLEEKPKRKKKNG